MLWLNLAIRMGVPTIYWSADTDQHDVSIRSLSMLTLYTGKQIEESYTASDKAREVYDQAMKGVSVEWVFDTAIPADRVAERMEAFAEMRGEYPHLVVLDNLSNAVQHEEQSRQEQSEFIMEMKRLGQFSKAHFAILAHAKGMYENGTTPIPQGGVLNNLAKVPEVMVTMHRADQHGAKLGINITKNRAGRPDPAAIHPVVLDVDYSRASVMGFSR